MSVHVDIQGQGDDLVLLHGWAMHGGVFSDISNTLAQRYRVHCIDLPGHGQSTARNDAVSVEHLANQILPQVPPRAVMLGWSLGGQVALQLATQTSLRALVLVSVTPKFVADSSWSHGMSSAVFAQFFAKLHENIESTVQDFLSLQVRGDIHAMRTLKTLRERLMQHPADATALDHSLAMLRDTDLRSLLPAINVPTLLIAGEHDRITHPRATQAMATMLPDAHYVEIKRAGHASFISHRDEFLKIVTDFLAKLPVGAA